jgi:ligand-binding SRPBCC domain-containing protein
VRKLRAFLTVALVSATRNANNTADPGGGCNVRISFVPIFTTEILLPAPRDGVFPFFADAMNLEEITPPWLAFSVLTEPPIEMRVGALIDYSLKLRGLPIRWRTEISAWDPPFSFVDRQLKGPYRRWIHTHTFEEVYGGTRVIDEVDYAAPGGWLVDRLFVRKEVRRIFGYRHGKLVERFGKSAR